MPGAKSSVVQSVSVIAPAAERVGVAGARVAAVIAREGEGTGLSGDGLEATEQPTLEKVKAMKRKILLCNV